MRFYGRSHQQFPAHQADFSSAMCSLYVVLADKHLRSASRHVLLPGTGPRSFSQVHPTLQIGRRSGCLRASSLAFRNLDPPKFSASGALLHS